MHELCISTDRTIIILHSGNHELVCLWHRASQTLYISDVIKLPTCTNPGYGKLHVGIYLAAIQDMIDHQKQLHPSPPPKPPCNDNNSISGDKDDEDQNDSDTGHGGHGHHGGSRAGGSCEGGSCGGGSCDSGAREKCKFQGGVGRKDAEVDELVAIEVRLCEPCKAPEYHVH